MRPEKVEIEGKEVKNVESCSFELEQRFVGNGYPGGNQRALQLTLTRAASPNTSIQGFALIANNDGTLKFTRGQVKLQDPQRKGTYTVSFEKAYAEHWNLSCTDGAEPMETLVLRSPDVKVGVGSDTAEMKLPDVDDRLPKS